MVRVISLWHTHATAQVHVKAGAIWMQAQEPPDAQLEGGGEEPACRAEQPGSRHRPP